MSRPSYLKRMLFFVAKPCKLEISNDVIYDILVLQISSDIDHPKKKGMSIALREAAARCATGKISCFLRDACPKKSASHAHGVSSMCRRWEPAAQLGRAQADPGSMASETPSTPDHRNICLDDGQTETMHAASMMSALNAHMLTKACRMKACLTSGQCTGWPYT